MYSSDGLWGDNQPHVIPIKIEQGDLEGGNKSAIVAVLGLWRGAYQTGTLINAYELVPFVEHCIEVSQAAPVKPAGHVQANV